MQKSKWSWFWVAFAWICRLWLGASAVVAALLIVLGIHSFLGGDQFEYWSKSRNIVLVVHNFRVTAHFQGVGEGNWTVPQALSWSRARTVFEEDSLDPDAFRFAGVISCMYRWNPPFGLWSVTLAWPLFASLVAPGIWVILRVQNLVRGRRFAERLGTAGTVLSWFSFAAFCAVAFLGIVTTGPWQFEWPSQNWQLYLENRRLGIYWYAGGLRERNSPVDPNRTVSANRERVDHLAGLRTDSSSSSLGTGSSGAGCSLYSTECWPVETITAISPDGRSGVVTQSIPLWVTLPIFMLWPVLSLGRWWRNSHVRLGQRSFPVVYDGADKTTSRG